MADPKMPVSEKLRIAIETALDAEFSTGELSEADKAGRVFIIKTTHVKHPGLKLGNVDLEIRYAHPNPAHGDPEKPHG